MAVISILFKEATFQYYLCSRYTQCSHATTGFYQHRFPAFHQQAKEYNYDQKSTSNKSVVVLEERADEIAYIFLWRIFCTYILLRAKTDLDGKQGNSNTINV